MNPWEDAPKIVMIDGFALDGEELPAIAEQIANGLRFVIGCERCVAVCVGQAVRCHCCAIYRKKSGGGAPSYYPDDGKHHRQLMAAEEFERRYLRDVDERGAA